jgi:hypothetical protein
MEYLTHVYEINEHEHEVIGSNGLKIAHVFTKDNGLYEVHYTCDSFKGQKFTSSSWEYVNEQTTIAYKSQTINNIDFKIINIPLYIEK